MSVIDFPIADRPVTESEIEKLHSKNFRDLEGRISDCMTMTAIAHELAMDAIDGNEPKHEKAQFAVCQSAKMLKQLQADYQAAWRGEIELDGN